MHMLTCPAACTDMSDPELRAYSCLQQCADDHEFHGEYHDCLMNHAQDGLMARLHRCMP